MLGPFGADNQVTCGLDLGYYVIEVGTLVQYSYKVPAWVTGVNNHPLAGIAGLLVLSGLGLSLQQFTQVKN